MPPPGVHLLGLITWSSVLQSTIVSAVKSATFSSDVYYSGFYWNDIPQMNREISRRSTGDEDMDWLPFLVEKWNKGKPFNRILSLSCGDGSIERWMYRLGGFRSGVGLDFLPQLVRTARQEAKRDRVPVTYRQHDINAEKLPPGPFDLVLVHAGAHHWGRVDFVMRQVAKVLTPGTGLFVLKEFVGPHRNQYPKQMWDAALAANNRLPEKYRNEMAYPHIPTMLQMDPSEAQHSELLMTTIRRYFYIERYRALCGALAYPVLTHNNALSAVYRSRNISSTEYDLVEHAVRKVIDEDLAYCNEDPDGRSLFAFIIARPLSGGVPNQKYQQAISDLEDAIEVNGTQSTYYTKTESYLHHYASSPPLLRRKMKNWSSAFGG